MLNLSIMPLDGEHVDEVCEDIFEQQKNGVSTHAMLTVYLSPIGNPVQKRAEYYSEIYKRYRKKLDTLGAKHGILVQSTLGHIAKPRIPHPFGTLVSLETGEPMESTCCPLDEGFRAHIKSEMHTLATQSPSLIMIDDDVGILYRSTKGCACPRHLDEFNKRAGTSLTREELYRHTQGDSEEDKRITGIYVDLIRDSLVGAVKAMREGIDEVDPTIQGIVSGIYVTTFCEFSGEIAEAFAGKGNPRIIRMNNGMYTSPGPRNFSKQMYRAAILKENVKDKVDIFLAETDTCPQNRYSTSAQLLHAHFTGTILEGATGAKHWITRLRANEPKSGIAYRKKLAKYRGFYEKLTEYAKDLVPVGCRIPLSTVQRYNFVKGSSGINTSPWSTAVLERFGLPLYFGNTEGGAVFIDGISAKRFSDDDFKKFFGGTVILSFDAAIELINRGFTDYIGVTVHEIEKRPSFELINGHRIALQVSLHELRPTDGSAKALSSAILESDDGERTKLFPAVSSYKNPSGGTTVTFSGTPDTEFNYYSAFSMLNESRKAQFIDFLKAGGNLPVYYPDDAEVYLRAGYLPSGEMMVAVFNLSLDALEEIPLVFERAPERIEMLNESGERVALSFTTDGERVTVGIAAGTLDPVILFIK